MRLFWIVFLPAAAYQVLAIFAALRQVQKARLNRPANEDFRPGVSVLKPLRGLDPNTYRAFVSHVRQDYPQFEILFGVHDQTDPAAGQVRRLQQEFPSVSIRLFTVSTDAPNGKVGTLAALSREAKYPIRVVNDSDILVGPDYLAKVISPLADSAIGVVTCPYRVEAHTAPAAWEAFGIATDFMPSTLVAQLLGVREFGFGSTLAFRAADLERVGGFGGIADYLADDYQLARRITGLGKRALLSTYVVETSLGDASWAGIWRHQLRWARTIRVSKGAGYAGLPIAQAGLWCFVALFSGAWVPAAILFGLRATSALLTGWWVLRSSIAKRFFLLSPLWDLYAFSIWLTSYFGRSVRWRDRTLKIDRDGRISR